MGTYLAFTLYSGTFLLALYLAYRIFAASEKQFKLNRSILIAIYLVSLAAWPLSRMDFTDMPSDTKEFNTSEIVSVERTLQTTESYTSVISIFAAIYLAGMIVILLLTLLDVLKTMRQIKGGYHVTKKECTLVVIPGEKIAPFSFFKFIVVGAADLSEERKYVIEHELAHIRGKHSLDLLLAQAVCIAFWYNPAAWGMRKELERVHEYQADAEVLSIGISPKEYQRQLIKEALGGKFKPLVNSLHQSDLKARITMMQKKRCSGIRKIIPISLVTAPLIASAALHSPFISEELNNLYSLKLSQFFPSTEKDNTSDVIFLDYYGNPMTTIATVSFADTDTIKDKEFIQVPFTAKEMEGLIFIVNGRLLPKDEEPIIFVNGIRWTRPTEEIDSSNIKSFSYRKDSKGRPFGIVDITLKK